MNEDGHVSGMRWQAITMFIALVFSGFQLLSGQAVPIDNPLKSHEAKLDIDSGNLYHNGKTKKTIWTETVTVEDAHWLRLKFSHLVLAGSPLGGTSSTLRITSLSDGEVQTLDAQSALQWRNTTAYFNGNTVRLELIAVPNGRLNLVKISSATAGENDGIDVTATICDDVDDRVLSNDSRAGRTAPGGCTGWLFNDRNNCFLTAGHCAPSTEVMLFNVPLSDANGNRQFPGPEDQYAVDFSSFQSVNGGVGNDWCYFGCFPNANTGLTAFQAQGDSYQLADPIAVQPGDMIRITGYGSTSFPVSPTWNGVQKTQVGAYAVFTNNELGYRTDTTGGNSGSPIIFENTGEAIGIHTHGGCGSGGGGTNFGTGVIQNGIANALENPLGICVLSIGFEFPDGLPSLISPDGGTTVLVNIDDADFEILGASATLSVNAGAGFQNIPMTKLGGNQFEGTFPASECGQVIEYFFSVESVEGDSFTNPTNAPGNFYAVISADALGALAFDDNFEADMNWLTSDSASTGFWERGIPAGGGDRNDPATDADGSGACFVTGLADGDNDIDGGSVVLTSPLMDATISNDQEAILSYYRWFNNGGSGDPFLIEISNNGGASWTTLEDIGTGAGSSGGWELSVFSIAGIITPTNQMQLRFTASDLNGGSIVEAGVDGVSIQLIDCNGKQVLLGDINMDGVVDLLDVQPFIDILVMGHFQIEADINKDGVVDLFDVQPFVDLLAS